MSTIQEIATRIKASYENRLTAVNPEDVSDKEVNDLAKRAISALNVKLKGKKFVAFGKRRGLWGNNETPVTYKIDKISPSEEHWHMHLGEDSKAILLYINIYPNGYTSKTYGLIYTDPTALSTLKDLFKSALGSNFVALDYTDQGMQGRNYISMNLEIKIR